MNLVKIVVRSGDHDSLKMNATAVRVVPFQFTVPLLILGSLKGNEVTRARLQFATVSPQRSSKIPSGYTAFPELGAAYKFMEKKYTWHDARQHCVSEGGNLAVFDSHEKLDLALILGSSHIYNAWNGVHNLFNPDEWVNVKDGSLVTFFSWHPSWPKDLRTRSCLAVSYDGVRKMTHYNVVCRELHTFFCEIPI